MRETDGGHVTCAFFFAAYRGQPSLVLACAVLGKVSSIIHPEVATRMCYVRVFDSVKMMKAANLLVVLDCGYRRSSFRPVHLWCVVCIRVSSPIRGAGALCRACPGRGD